MTTLVVNCRSLPFSSTLGVAAVLLGTCEPLSKTHSLVFVTNDLDATMASPAWDRLKMMADDAVEPDDPALRSAAMRRRAIELLPHHFQAPEFCDRSILTCLDLHVFDVPWKYGDNASAMQDRLRRAVGAANAVLTPFPRTYYRLELVAGMRVPNLYLTESPLLLDSSPAFGRPPTSIDERGTARLLYPAQLQEHKNHAALVRGARIALERGVAFRIDCPGSSFSPELTEDIRSTIEEAGLGDHIRLLGRIDDQELIEAYADCDAVVVPSLAEGGAYVALEALAAGRPAAVNSLESARMHLAAFGGAVRWFDATDDDDVAATLEALATEDPDVWAERNAACRRRIEAQSWSVVAEKYDRLIDFLDGRAARPILLTDRNARDIVYT